MRAKEFDTRGSWLGQMWSHSIHEGKQGSILADAAPPSTKIIINDRSTKLSSNVENNFLATLTRLQNVGKKLDEWLKQESSFKDTGTRFCQASAVHVGGSSATLEKAFSNLFKEGADASNHKAISDTILSSINLSDSFSSIRGTMSHGLSPDFQLPSDELRYPTSSQQHLAPESSHEFFSDSKSGEMGGVSKSRYTQKHDDVESSLASLSPVTSMPTSQTATPRSKQVRIYKVTFFIDAEFYSWSLQDLRLLSANAGSLLRREIGQAHAGAPTSADYGYYSSVGSAKTAGSSSGMHHQEEVSCGWIQNNLRPHGFRAPSPPAQFQPGAGLRPFRHRHSPLSDPCQY